MNSSETRQTLNRPGALFSSVLEQAPVIHTALSGGQLGWNMINEPVDGLSTYEDDLAFPADKYHSIKIICPQTERTVKALGDWTIEISRSRPLTVGDVLKGLYREVNRSVHLPDGMPLDERRIIGLVGNLRTKTITRSMSDSLDYSDQYTCKVVDCFYGMSLFAGLKQSAKDTWELNITHGQALYGWYLESIQCALGSTTYGKYEGGMARQTLGTL